MLGRREALYTGLSSKHKGRADSNRSTGLSSPILASAQINERWRSSPSFTSQLIHSLDRIPSSFHVTLTPYPRWTVCNPAAEAHNGHTLFAVIVGLSSSDQPSRRFNRRSLSPLLRSSASTASFPLFTVWLSQLRCCTALLCLDALVPFSYRLLSS